VTRAVASAPSSWFTDPQFLARERAAVFAPHWHYVGSAADVAEPGSFMAAIGHETCEFLYGFNTGELADLTYVWEE
jgi:hypothetical protein